MEVRNGVFYYFHYQIVIYCVELFECTFNFKFCENIFIFLIINTIQISKEQFYKKQPLNLVAAVEKCSGSKLLSGLQLSMCNIILSALFRNWQNLLLKSNGGNSYNEYKQLINYD